MTDTDKTESPAAPHVKDKSQKPLGLMPKNIQTWAVLGIAVVMILVIAFSGGKSPSADSSKTPKPPNVVDPNEARIQEYRDRIDQDARQLSAEQDRLRSAKQAMAVTATQTPPEAPAQYSATPIHRSEPPNDSREVQKNAELEREKREYQSLFASNIALTYRKDEIAGKGAAPLAGGSSQPLASLAQNPYGLFPAAMPVLSVPEPQVQTAGQPESKQETNPEVQSQPSDKTKPAQKETLPDRPPAGFYRIFEGTVIEAVLTNRLTGSFSGPVNCVVTTDVYSRDGQHVVIPRGSRVLGEANKVEAFGQERLAVVFHRLITPDGYSVRLDHMPGLDQAGETGLRDKVNNHYVKMFGMSLAIGALSGLTQYNTQYGTDASSGDVYRQGVSRSLGDTSLRILDRFTNILPTFTIREGHRVKIYLTADLDLPPEKGEPK